MKNFARKGNILIVVAIAALITIGAALYFKANTNTSTSPKEQYSESPRPKETINNNFKSYTSQALKISFKYPKEWYVDEKDRDILITSYKTRIGENKAPNENQIKIFIDEFSGCHKTIEENLIDPACGEGGPSVKKNKILSKEVRETKGGTFYKYIIESPNQKFTFYLLEKEDKVLQIEKKPDPSQFEKEFEEIVNSIQFLP